MLLVTLKTYFCPRLFPCCTIELKPLPMLFANPRIAWGNASRSTKPSRLSRTVLPSLSTSRRSEIITVVVTITITITITITLTISLWLQFFFNVNVNCVWAGFSRTLISLSTSRRSEIFTTVSYNHNYSYNSNLFIDIF